MLIDYIVPLIVILTYFLHHYLDTIAHFSRIAGKVTYMSATGASIYNSLIILSRLLLAIMLPLLALLVDLDIKEDHLINIFLISQTFVFFGITYSIIKVNSFIPFFIIFIKRLNSNGFISSLFYSLFKPSKEKKIFFEANLRKIFGLVHHKEYLISLVANTFLSSGFFISFYLASQFSDFQLSFSQLSFAIHGIGAIMNAVFLEYRLGQQNDKHNELLSFSNNLVLIVTFGRGCGFLLSAILWVILI